MSTQTNAYDSETHTTSFLSKVFAAMATMLGITAGTSILANDLHLPAFFEQHPVIFIMLLIFEVLLVAVYGFIRKEKLLLLPMLFVYTVINGITLSVVVNYYSVRTLLEALFASGGLFVVLGVMSAAGVNILRARNLLAGSLVALILTMIVGIFLQSATFDLVISGCAVLLFSGLTLFDLNALGITARGSHNIYDVLDGALSLYLDFLNIFLNLLRTISGTEKD